MKWLAYAPRSEVWLPEKWAGKPSSECRCIGEREVLRTSLTTRATHTEAAFLAAHAGTRSSQCPTRTRTDAGLGRFRKAGASRMPGRYSLGATARSRAIDGGVAHARPGPLRTGGRS